MEIVFFGSGPVAARSLEMLSKNFNVEAVITKPRPAHHKGSVPVLSLSEKLGLKTYTASNKQSLSGLMSDIKLNSKVAVLIDFGIIVSQDVIDYFPLGIVNSHFSLLPLWRGADPISFALLNGDEKTGVSLMLIDKGMDTGKLIAQKSLPIKDDHTGPTLTEDLIELSHRMLSEKLPAYVSGDIKPRAQPHPSRATYSAKLNKSDGNIDWSKPAEQIEREVRTYIEWPKSHTSIGSKDIVIKSAKIADRDIRPGEIVVEDKQLFIGCGNKALKIEQLQPAGKKSMDAQSFIAGYGNLLKS